MKHLLLLLCLNQLISASSQQAKADTERMEKLKKEYASAEFERTEGNWEVDNCNAKTVITILLSNGVTLGKTTENEKTWFWAKQQRYLQNIDITPYKDKKPLFTAIEQDAEERDRKSFLCIPYQSTHSVTRKYKIYDDGTCTFIPEN